MADELFIGIVPRSDPTKPSWIGAFHFDHVEGYSGKILSTTQGKISDDLFRRIPKELTEQLIPCVVDGAEFSTLIRAHFSGVRINNFVSATIDARVPAILRGVHIDQSERSVTKLYLHSPLIAAMFGLRGFKETFEPSARKLTIESIPVEELKFDAKIGSLYLGIEKTFGPSRDGLSPKVNATGYLRLEFRESQLLIDAFDIAHRLEQLLSLLSFSSIKAEKLQMSIDITEGKDAGKNSTYEIQRGLLLKEAKTEIPYHEIPIFMSDGIDFGLVAQRFLDVHETIEQTLNWYRIVVAEDRYLEDKYFYAVRMIDALYQRLDIRTETDQSAAEPSSEILSLLNEVGKSALADFFVKRVLPMFSKTSLSDRIRDLKERYTEFKVVSLIDERTIGKLRGKEAHGSTKRFTSEEYTFMAFAYDVLTKLYALLILEHCGMKHKFLVSNLTRPHVLQQTFSDQWIEILKKNKQSDE